MCSDDIFYLVHAYAYLFQLHWIDLFRHISIFAVEPSSRNVEDSSGHGQELVTFSSGLSQGSRTSSTDHTSSSGYHFTRSESSGTSRYSASINDGTRRTSAGDSSQISGTLVQSNQNGQTGISLFQGYWPSACYIFLY